MRQATARKQAERKRDSPKEPLIDNLLKRGNEGYIFKTGERSLRNWHVLEAEIRGIIDIYGILPSAKRLVKLGYGDVAGAIMRHHDGFRKIRLKLKRIGIKEGAPKNLQIKIRKFKREEIEYIRSRRKQLINEGKCDTDIARILAEELQRKESSIANKIAECEEENPNKKKISFTKKDIELLKKLRAKYMSEGLWDTKIAQKIHTEFGRGRQSIIAKIASLVSCGELVRNSNVRCSENRKTYSRDELDLIKSRRAELISQGYMDGEIARKIAHEFKRTPATLREKFRLMRNNGDLDSNPNKRISYTSKQNEEIINLWNVLNLEGLPTSRISEIIGFELGIKPKSAVSKLERLKRGKLIEESRNSYKFKYSSKDVFHISRIREDLMGQGWKDWRIAKNIAEEMGEGAELIYQIIRNLVKEEKIRENSNMPTPVKKKNLLKNKTFAPEEIEYIEERRCELIKEGFGDYSIAKKVAPEINRKFESVTQKIYQLMRGGKFGKNPNNRGFSKEHLEIIKHVREALIQIGYKDSRISRELAGQIYNSEGSIREKIRMMIEKGELPKNPNRDKKRKRDKPKRFYQDMSNEILVSYGKKVILEIKASLRRELKDADAGLHEELRKRRLLDRAFEDVDRPKRLVADQKIQLGLAQAADAMEKFGDVG